MKLNRSLTCVCGHDYNQHAPANIAGALDPEHCSVPDCGCPKFLALVDADKLKGDAA